MKFNSNLITYIESESVDWMSKLKTEGLQVSFPNKGKPTKKIYDQFQLALCDVMDGDPRRFDDLKGMY